MKYVYYVLICFLFACSTSTNINSTDPLLRPRTIKGNIEDILKLCSSVMMQTFPDGNIHIDNNYNSIIVIRQNRLRGDTIIKVMLVDNQDGTITVNVSSEGYGTNFPMIDYSTGEVRNFNKSFDQLYLNNLSTIQKPKQSIRVDSEEPIKRLPSKYDDYFKAVVVVRANNSIGTGTILTSDGFIITNAHVVQKENEVNIKFYSGKLGIAKVIKTDNERDLALLKIDILNSSYFDICEIEKTAIGSEVIAIGTPQGLDWSLTKGIISAIRRSNSIYLIQTDTPINHGNSGGPLVSLIDGKIVGINTLGVRKDIAEGLNFAVASSKIKFAFPEIFRN